jgi:hypothetical protein
MTFPRKRDCAASIHIRSVIWGIVRGHKVREYDRFDASGRGSTSHRAGGGDRALKRTTADDTQLGAR